MAKYRLSSINGFNSPKKNLRLSIDYYTDVITIQMMGYLEHHTLNIVFSIFIEVCDGYPIVFTFLQAVRTILLSKFGFGHRSNSFVVKVWVLW